MIDNMDIFLMALKFCGVAAVLLACIVEVEWDEGEF